MWRVEIDVPTRGPITLQTLADGEMLGWSWLFPPYRWQFDARAVDRDARHGVSTAPAFETSAKQTTTSATSC